MNINFIEYAKIYDAIYKNKNYKQESIYIHRWIQSMNPRAKTLLDLGSGTGRHCEQLVEFGYDISGIEKSLKMVELAKERLGDENYNIIHGDITNFNLDQIFDVAISLFHVMNYQVENKDITNVFLETNRHLHMGGIFIFDSWYAPAVLHLKPEKRITTFASEEFQGVRKSTPIHKINKNVVDVLYEITLKDKMTNKTSSISELHSIRYFSIPEISLIADNYGFTIIKTEEYLTKKEPGIDTWGVCFILKKIENINV